jgi:hypothetical protein
MRPLAGKRRLVFVACAYACVALCYCGFFAMPVTPAEPSDAFSFVVEDRVYSAFPRIHETLYTNGKAFIAIATIRTVSAPSSAYSLAFDRLDGYAEAHVRDQYGIDVDIEAESSLSDYSFSGHSATRYYYGVFKDVTVLGMTHYVKVAEIGAIAWFCNVDFESVVLIYVTPAYFIDDPSLLGLGIETLDVVDAVSCH